MFSVDTCKCHMCLF